MRPYEAKELNPSLAMTVLSEKLGDLGERRSQNMLGTLRGFEQMNTRRRRAETACSSGEVKLIERFSS